jgi:hypothetical protein
MRRRRDRLLRSAISQGYRCDCAIVGEPTSLNAICAHCGSFLKLTTPASPPHAATLDGRLGGRRMMELVESCALRSAEFPAPDPRRDGPEPGEIHAGDRPNRVPNLCEARIDIRLVSPITNDRTFEAARGVTSATVGRLRGREARERSDLNRGPTHFSRSSRPPRAEHLLGPTGFRGPRRSFHAGGIDAVTSAPAASTGPLQRVRLDLRTAPPAVYGVGFAALRARSRSRTNKLTLNSCVEGVCFVGFDCWRLPPFRPRLPARVHSLLLDATRANKLQGIWVKFCSPVADWPERSCTRGTDTATSLPGGCE